MHRMPIQVVRATFLAPLLALGLASFFFIRSQQGNSLVIASLQSEPRSLTRAAVDSVVKLAPDPVSNEKASAATCVPRGKGALSNPWQCTLSYPTGRRVAWSIDIHTDGTYVGENQVVLAPPPQHSEPGSITGCCVNVP
jgi:hypothetical protein